MISRRGVLRLGSVGLGTLGAAFAARAGWQSVQLRQARGLYAGGLAAPEGALRVYHLGHSLVGRDMPAMLAQLAGAGHDYASQLGWGANLRSHFEPDVPVNGFADENAHPQYRPARATIEAGTYDAVIMTEMVELRDAIKYHDSATYLAKWAMLARAARPDVRLYLYETWHNTNDPAGWYNRIDADYEALWLDRVALPASLQIGAPIFIIPGGQVMAAMGRALDNSGGSRDMLMARTPEGEVDTIHLSDLGTYLIALTHYATLYQRDPQGLPLALTRADGTAAVAPDAQMGAMMQKIVWDVVRATPLSGVNG